MRALLATLAVRRAGVPWGSAALIGLVASLLSACGEAPRPLDAHAQFAGVERLVWEAASVESAGLQRVREPFVEAGPAPAEGSRMVIVDDEARRAVGVSQGWPVSARLRAPEGGVLSLSYAVPPDCGRPEALGLTLSAEGVASQTLRLPLADALTWQRIEIPLEASGQLVSVRAEILGEQPGAAVVAEAAVHLPGARPRPSVLLVTSDTHRADHLGVAGEGVAVTTPNLDALAARGVLFEDCFSSTNLTNPSHIALMTGLHPRDHGILNNRTRLVEEAVTLAERFAEAGYTTWAALSAHHLGDVTSGLGQGFDRAQWTRLAKRPGGETVDVLERWLPDAEGRPLFVWLHLFDAHLPYNPPADFDRIYYDGPEDPFDPALPDPGVAELLPDELRELRVLDYASDQYRALVSYLDRELGRVLAWDRFANGVVGFVADHGESLGEHEVYFSHAELFPESVRVPFVLAGGGVPVGERVSAPVRQIDLGRTLLDLAGLEDAEFPGRNVLGAAQVEQPRFLIASHARSAAVSWRGLHLILSLRPHGDRRDRHHVQLFDRNTDPDCLIDLVDERPEEARWLRERLIDWLQSAQALYWAGPVAEDPELLETLRRLGYVEDGGAASEAPSMWVEDDCVRCQRFR